MFCQLFFRRSLGGKLGAHLEETFKAEYMYDLVQYTKNQLQTAVGQKNG